MKEFIDGLILGPAKIAPDSRRPTLIARLDLGL